MSSLISALIMAIPILFFYSSRIEKSRVVTIAKPLVITQARKTPAFDLYRHAQKLEVKKIELEIQNSTFLNTESALATVHVLAMNEMKFDRQEIGSVQDYGFQVTQQKMNLKAAADLETAPPPFIQSIEKQPVPALIQANSSPLQKWGTVRGKFEVKDGVGVVDHIVEVKRIEEGQVREIGQVDLRAGSYSIDIENPQGYLIAQIKDRNGSIIGSDQQKIINLASHGNYFEGPFIRVGKPPDLGVNPAIPNPSNSDASVASNPPSHGRPGPPSERSRNSNRQQESSLMASLFSSQHLMEKPNDKFSNISRNSSTISFVEDKKDIYSKIISIRQGADESETPLFTKKWIYGTLEYISDHQKIEFKSKQPPLLIGRVFKDGKTVRGAHVQLESDPGINAIYLDQFMIPNFNQDGTSENGYFMFVGLESNSYSAVAFENNKIIGQQVFVADENVISYQSIMATTNPRVIIVRAFDAFTAQPVEADVMSADSDDIIEVQHGIASYRTNNALGVVNYVVRPKLNYMPINFIQDARLDYVHIPAISEAWLLAMQTDLQSHLEINDQANTGTIIGFVPELDYEMYIIAEGYDQKQIVYFDQLGGVTSEPTRGGGFVLFNVPAGAQEIVVQEKKTERIYSQVHIVKSNQTSVSHFSE